MSVIHCALCIVYLTLSTPTYPTLSTPSPGYSYPLPWSPPHSQGSDVLSLSGGVIILLLQSAACGINQPAAMNLCEIVNPR